MKFLFGVFLFVAVAATTSSFVFYNQLKHAKKQIKVIDIDEAILKKKLSQKPPAWMSQQIEEDLLPYRQGISKKMLDDAFSGRKIRQCSLVRFTIKDSHISFAHDEKTLYARHFKELLASIKKLNECTPLPDVDFIVSLEDGFESNPNIGPTFVFAKNRAAKDLVLIPDINALVGYSKLRKMIPKASVQFPWEKKRGMGFWRGSTTGGYSTLNNWENLARAKLVLLSLANPNAVDARFSAIVQCDPEIPGLMKAKGMVSKSVTKADHLQYKFLVDVDGNSCSYERYFWLLLSNSLVLKQMTPNVQWYYKGLEPYKHYVPVKHDLSDLIEKVEWAKTHDEEAKKIAENATLFVKENLSSEDTLVYLYLLMKEYSKLMK